MLRDYLILFILSTLVLTSGATTRADFLNIYSDIGIPEHAELFVWSANNSALAREIVDAASPEGIRHFVLQDGGTWQGWGVVLCARTTATPTCAKDLSAFVNGRLEFWVRTSVDLKVEVEAPRGTKRGRYLSNYVRRFGNEWQKVSIPIRDFRIAPEDLQKVYAPLLITADTRTTSFAVDQARWVTDLPAMTQSTVSFNEAKELMINQRPATLRGVDGEFVPVGKLGPSFPWADNPDQYEPDVPLMKDLGVNAVRLYREPTSRKALDAFFKAGIFVLIDFPIAGELDEVTFVDFGNAEVRQRRIEEILNIVNHWKQHPAVLGWLIGNEVNVHTNRNALGNWFSFVNEAARAVKIADPHHLVTTALAESPAGVLEDIKNFDSMLNDIDTWSVQLYRGPTFGSVFTDYRKFSAKPLLLTEFGCDAFDGRRGVEDQRMQADCLESQWLDLKPHLKTATNQEPLIGTFVFAWRDGWWKSEGDIAIHNVFCARFPNPGFPDACINEEWWGLVAITRNPSERLPREAYFRLQTLWAAPPFVRGDADGNQELDLTDAVFTLEFLFRGGSVPRCMDAADASDDGQVDISDAVKTLHVLFQGGTMSAPFPEPGADPTDDTLECR